MIMITYTITNTPLGYEVALSHDEVGLVDYLLCSGSPSGTLVTDFAKLRTLIYMYINFAHLYTCTYTSY